jgi:hypothetical protein
MRKHLSRVSVSIALVLMTAISHGDNPPSLPETAAREPITGTPAVNAYGSETPRHDPFTPYDPGPPGMKTWSYKDLSPSERAWADQTAKSNVGWDKVQSGYAAAVKERAHLAIGDSAAHQLGIVDDLGSTGVVP